MQVDLNQGHVMSEYLQRYVLVGEPYMAGKAIKILRLAAFAPAVPSSMDYNVRVYFLEDTQDAFEVGFFPFFISFSCVFLLLMYHHVTLYLLQRILANVGVVFNQHVLKQVFFVCMGVGGVCV